MRKYFLAALLTAALFGTLSAQASIVTYNFTADGGHFGDFTYDDTAVTVGNGPYSAGGVAYNAISFDVDGSSVSDPLLVLYQNFGGNQFAYFTNTNGFVSYVQLAVDGTGLFSSSAADQMDGRTLSDFANSEGFNFLCTCPNGNFAITSLTLATSAPEPGTFAMLLFAGLGLIPFVAAKKKSDSQL